MILAIYLEELNKWRQRLHSDIDWSAIQILKQIEERLGLTYVPEPLGALQSMGNVCLANSPEVRDDYKDTFSAVDLLDYIYAVLHSSGYREKYKEFLKIDFQRVPCPDDADTFWQLVALGRELRKLHLLKASKVKQFKTTFPKDGDNLITRKLIKNNPGFEPNKNVILSISSPPNIGSVEGQVGKVYINDTQYFDNVPQNVWEFYIGGYQPAQKWLKDRRGSTLGFEDIMYYQKIIGALTETNRIMQEIDTIEIGK